jgi:hypothetical protein
LIDPVVAGAFFYYGWKKMLPNKAKQANAISLWAFLILLILGVGYYFAFHPSLPDTSTSEVNSVTNTQVTTSTAQPNTVTKTSPASNTTSVTQNIPTGWQSVTSDKGTFSLSFPVTPTHTLLNSSSNPAYDGVPYTRDSYKASTAQARYGVDETKYSSTVSDMTAEEMAKTLLEGMVQSDSNNQLVTSTPSKFGTHTSLDFLFTNKTSNLALKGKIIILNQTDIVVLTVVTNANNTTNDSNYQQFINSFQLK